MLATEALRIAKEKSNSEFQSVIENIKTAAENGETRIRIYYEKDGVSNLLRDAGYKVSDICIEDASGTKRITSEISW